MGLQVSLETLLQHRSASSRFSKQKKNSDSSLGRQDSVKSFVEPDRAQVVRHVGF